MCETYEIDQVSKIQSQTGEAHAVATCGSCGSEARDEARFCPACGKPMSARPAAPVPALEALRPPPAHPPQHTSPWDPVTGPIPVATRPVGPPTVGSAVPSRWSPPVVAALVAILVVVAVGSGAATWYFAGGGGQATAEADSPLVLSPTSSAPTPASTTPGVPASLNAQAEADRPAARALIGRWVPQLSTKAAGMQVGGVTYDDASILQLFQSLRARYPSAVLVDSSEYSSFRRGGLWVVLAGEPFADPASANAWCDAQNIGPDDCFAKRLSTTDGPDGNTVPR